MSKAFDELVALLDEYGIDFVAEMDGGETEFWIACPAHAAEHLVELMRYASPSARLRYAAERLKAVRSDVFLDESDDFLSGVEWSVRMLNALSREEESESDE